MELGLTFGFGASGLSSLGSISLACAPGASVSTAVTGAGASLGVAFLAPLGALAPVLGFGVFCAVRYLTEQQKEAAARVIQKFARRRLAKADFKERSLREVSMATHGFSSTRLLGRGGMGAVFLGTLDGSVAIKEVSKGTTFARDVAFLRTLRHGNIVRVLGCAQGPSKAYIIMEFLAGGDLFARLNRDKAFAWQSRLQAVAGCVRGISYLHGLRPKVFHRDIKSQNILLSETGDGKVADFDCAIVTDLDPVLVEHRSGTPGYADPVYLETGYFSASADMFSVGMVLLEVLTRKPPAVVQQGRLAMHYENVDTPRVLGMIDARALWPPAVAQRVTSLALQCFDRSLRPEALVVAHLLKDILADTSSQAARGFLALTLPNGSAYDGEVRHCVPHGQGRLSSSTSKGFALYEGQFLDGKRHGSGKQLLPSGKVIEGIFQGGVLQRQ